MNQKIIKINLYNNEKLVIENYNEITDINNDYIKIDFYQINGSNLKIKKINDYCIEIVGCIDNINIIKNDDK